MEKTKKNTKPKQKTKVCNVCGKEKPLSEFNKDCTKKDGYRNQCRECTAKKRKTATAKKMSEHIVRTSPKTKAQPCKKNNNEPAEIKAVKCLLDGAVHALTILGFSVIPPKKLTAKAKKK